MWPEATVQQRQWGERGQEGAGRAHAFVNEKRFPFPNLETKLVPLPHPQLPSSTSRVHGHQLSGPLTCSLQACCVFGVQATPLAPAWVQSGRSPSLWLLP